MVANIAAGSYLFKILMTFKELNLSGAITSALDEKGYQAPSPIQQKTIPHILAGKDIVASAATGTGKTAIQHPFN